MSLLEQLLPFLAASVLLTISPGPDIIYVLVQSMANGKKAGLITTLGLVSGIIIHTSLVAFGVSAVINESENLFLIIKILGATYLFFLAYKVWKSDSPVSIRKEVTPLKENFSLFKKGFIMNVLNPKVTIFFLAFFPGFLWEPSENPVIQIYILGLLFMVQAFLIFGLVALFSGKISLYLQKDSSTKVIVKCIQIIVFIGIGTYILV